MKQWCSAILLAASLIAFSPARAQPSSEAVAVAKELLTAIRVTDQLRSLMPQIMQQLKAAVVQGRPEVAAEYDRIVPILLARTNERSGALVEATALLYATHFTAAELREVIKFYQTPVGQKFIQKLPEITQQGLAIGNRFGQEIARELQKQMIDELRNRGHKL